MKAAREQRSFEAQARAKQQLLYRKGLIRDFHAAMAYSKVLKDTEDMKKAKGQREVCKFMEEPCADESAKLPIETENCYKRLQMENDWPDYTKKQKEKKICRPEYDFCNFLIKLLNFVFNTACTTIAGSWNS